MFENIKNLFSKKEGQQGMDIDMILNICKSFGFDPFAMVEKKLPEWLAGALKLEHQAAARLMGTLTISDDSSYFVLCIYKIFPDGRADLFKAWPLNNLPALIDEIKQAVSNPDHAPESPIEHLTISGGSNSQPDLLSTTTDQIPAGDGNPGATAPGASQPAGSNG